MNYKQRVSARRLALLAAGLTIWFLLVLLLSMAFLDGWLARGVFSWLPDTLLQFALVEGEQEPVGGGAVVALLLILTERSAVVFDSRPHMEYAISHIPGALNVAPKPGVPMSVYVSDTAEIERLMPDKAAPIVLYCNGPFCGKSKRLSEELLESGFTNVRRYQLGAPVWRALVGVMEIELDGVRKVWENDRTAVFIDARPAVEFRTGSLPGARNVPLEDVTKAKDDERLPMEDHNTRIIVFGADAAQARSVTAEVAKNAFHNVAYYPGALEDLVTGLSQTLAAAP